jgi:hypothetical protein
MNTVSQGYRERTLLYQNLAGFALGSSVLSYDILDVLRARKGSGRTGARIFRLWRRVNACKDPLQEPANDVVIEGTASPKEGPEDPTPRHVLLRMC